MDKKIQKLLETNKIKYKLTEHRKVYTAFNEAQTQHVDPKSVVKTVLIKLSKPITHLIETPSRNLAAAKNTQVIDCVLVAVPSKKRVDFKKIAKVINDHQAKSYKILVKDNPKLKKPSNITVTISKEKDIISKFKTKIGLLTAFSQIYNVPLLFDKKLSSNKKLIISAGSYTESIEITTKDFLKILRGIQGNFTE